LNFKGIVQRVKIKIIPLNIFKFKFLLRISFSKRLFIRSKVLFENPEKGKNVENTVYRDGCKIFIDDKEGYYTYPKMKNW